MSAFSQDFSGLPTSYPADPQVDLGFEAKVWRFENLGTTNDLVYSFDGVNDHGRLEPAGNANSSPSSSEGVPQRVRKAWLRGEAGATDARVSASSHGL